SEHRTEKCVAVFGKSDAQIKDRTRQLGGGPAARSTGNGSEVFRAGVSGGESRDRHLIEHRNDPTFRSDILQGRRGFSPDSGPSTLRVFPRTAPEPCHP